MKVCLIGSKGRMGTILGGILQRAGHEIKGIDVENIEDAVRVSRESDFTILAVPLSATLKYIESLGQDTEIVEISSVKEPLKKYSGRIISIHPLFGPDSFPENRKVCLIENISPKDSLSSLKTLLPECEFIAMTSDSHDRMMSESLVAPYLLSIMAKSINSESTGITHSGTVIQNLLSITGNMNADVITDTILLNPNTENILNSMENILRTIRESAVH